MTREPLPRPRALSGPRTRSTSPHRLRTVATAVAATLVVGLAGACTSEQPSSGSNGPSGSSSAGAGDAESGSTGGGATTTAPPTGQAVAGAPAELADLVTTIYAGGELGAGATESAATALAGRTPTSATVDAEAKVGSWLGTPVAVVTNGADVTLAVGPTWKVVGGWWPSLGVEKPALGSGPRWVLAIGSDARPGEDLERTRADVLQVVGMDGKGGGGIMGMARDLWVPLSTGGKGKINSAMVFGGPAAQLSTVRSVTSLPIEGYVLLGFEGFKKIVDEQGGIPIVIPKTVDAKHAHLVIKAGPQVLSGAEALAYARERKTLPDGDFGRSRHQGEVILASALKAKLAGPGSIPAALTSFGRYGKSDLDAQQMLTFAAGLYQLKATEVGRGVAKGGFGWAGKQSIVVLGSEAKSLFAQFRDGNLS